MRYYRIELTDPKNPKGRAQIYTSWVGGKNDPGALNVMFQARVVSLADPGENFWLKIQGIPVQNIGQSANLNGKNIAIYGGFQKGLPLANPKQSGLLVKGNVLQCFGNWVGNFTELNMFVTPGMLKADDALATPKTGTMDSPLAASFQWLPGQSLATAMGQMFGTAFPDYQLDIAISPSLVWSGQVAQSAVYRTLSGFAEWVGPFSRKMMGGSYPGVSIWIDSDTVHAIDGTVPPKTIEISFMDLIGQPVWLAPLEMQFKCPMRADLSLSNRIKMPTGIFPAIAGSVPAPFDYRNKAQQQGTFDVIEVNHYGDFRNPSGEAWATSVRCAFLPAGGAA